MMRQEFSFNKSLQVLWRFKWIVALVVLVAAVTAWGLTAGQPPVYEARAAVMVENVRPGPSGSSAGPANAFQYSYYQDIGSQIQMIQSRNVPEQVVTKLEPQKAKDPEYLQLEANKLSESLRVWQEGDTDLVIVSVISSDPVTAQKQADAVAEVYVNEFGQARVAAVKTALENTTTQLKELNATEVDLSISPLLTTVTAKIDTALAALKAADEHLKKVEIQQDAESPVEAVPVVLATMSQQVEIAAKEAKDLSALSQQLNTLPMAAVFEDHSLGIAIFESQTRSLSAKLGILSTEVDTLQRREIDPQVQGQLLTVKEQLQVASTSTGAILDQVLALYSVEERLRLASTAAEVSTQEIAMQQEAGAKLLQRIVQHSSLMTANLEAVSEPGRDNERKAERGTRLRHCCFGWNLERTSASYFRSGHSLYSWRTRYYPKRDQDSGDNCYLLAFRAGRFAAE
jgi:capsular polysaccharide biosynthesis protein